MSGQLAALDRVFTGRQHSYASPVLAIVGMSVSLSVTRWH